MGKEAVPTAIRTEVEHCALFSQPSVLFREPLLRAAENRLHGLPPLHELEVASTELSPDEETFLLSLSIEGLAKMDEEVQEAFFEHANKWLNNYAYAAQTLSFSQRHHHTLQLFQAFEPIANDKALWSALVLWWGWYGAKVHGGCLILNEGYLNAVLSPKASADGLRLIETGTVWT